MIIYQGKFARKAYLNNILTVVQSINIVLLFINIINQMSQYRDLTTSIVLLTLFVALLIVIIVLRATNVIICTFALENDHLVIKGPYGTLNDIELPTQHMSVNAVEPLPWFSSRPVKRLMIYDKNMSRLISISECMLVNMDNVTGADRKPSDYLAIETGIIDELQRVLDSYCQK